MLLILRYCNSVEITQHRFVPGTLWSKFWRVERNVSFEQIWTIHALIIIVAAAVLYNFIKARRDLLDDEDEDEGNQVDVEDV